MPKRILATGGTGFLGSAFLANQDHRNIVVLGRTRPAGFGGEWIKADLAGTLPLGKLPNDIGAVVHLAQSNKYRDFPSGAGDMFAVNVSSTAQLLQWAAETGVESFVYASTGNVYGARPGLCSEDDAANVRGDYYGATKLAAECLIDGFSQKLATCNLRLYGLYGPGQPTNKMMGTLIERVRTGQALSVQGNTGGFVTQPTYVDDVVAIIDRALGEGWKGALNVAGPECASIRQLGELIGRAFGRHTEFTIVAGEPPAPRLPDLTRLRELASDFVYTSLETGIARTVAALAAESTAS